MGSKFSMGLQSFSSGWEWGEFNCLVLRKPMAFAIFQGGRLGLNPSSRNDDLDVWHNVIDLV